MKVSIPTQNTHTVRTQTHTALYLPSINSVCCRAIGEAITSSPMVSVIEVHASFRRPSCYRSSHLSSISLAILLSPHLASPVHFLLIICLYFQDLPPPSFHLFFRYCRARFFTRVVLLSSFVDIDLSISLEAQ